MSVLSNGERLFRWPLAQHTVTAGWTYSDGSAHGAIDLRATEGTSVMAAENGVVDWIQRWNGWEKTGNQSYGNLVRIRHGDYKGKPLYSLYAHLSSVSVQLGQPVKEGQEIGLSGQSGNCFGAHLHFEVQYGGTGSARRVNPLNWLDRDFTCAAAEVQRHLGRYVSVRKPMAAKRYLITATGDDGDKLLALVNQLGLPCQPWEEGA